MDYYISYTRTPKTNVDYPTQTAPDNFVYTLNNTATVSIVDAPAIPTANMLWWFKADAIVGLSSGATVTSWVDSATTPHNLDVQTGGGSAPTYQTGQINGLPVVRVNASNVGIMQFPNFSPKVEDQSFTHYWVGSYNNVQSGNGLLVYTYTTSSSDVIRLAISFDIGGSNGIGWEYNVSGGNTDVFIAAGTSGVQLLTYVFDKSAGNGKIYRDGTQIGSTSTNVGGVGAGNGFDWGQDDIDFFNIQGGSQTVVGDHAEFIGYSTAHDDTTRMQIENSLKSKYGIGIEEG